MKKILYLIAVLSILGITGSSCRVRPLNGDLDAQWQLMTVETPNSTVTPQAIYYAFYRHTANFRPGTTTANLTYNEDTKNLTLEFPVVASRPGNQEGTSLDRYYIPDKIPCTVNFKVKKLTSKQLIMTLDDNTTYTFRKF